MSWPIPNIPVKAVMSSPDYKRWSIILLAMSLAGVLLAIYPGNSTSYGQILLYGLLPAILLWLCFFGGVFYRYQRSINALLLWSAETKRTKQLWQRWSRKQQIVVSNVVLTPEENGVLSLLGEPADVPAYPAKARALFTELSTLEKRLAYIDRETEKQCPGYRHHLGKIEIQYSARYQTGVIEQAVYNRWDLFPECTNTKESFCADDNNEQSGLILLLCVQDWGGSQAEQYSEFITAQLIVSEHFTSRAVFPVIAGVGRLLSSNSLPDALDMLVEYNRLETTKMRYVWLSGMDNDERVRLIQHLTLKQWPLPERHPFISLDHSFGPPGPLMFPVAISLLTDAVKFTNENQLIIFVDAKNNYSICFITRELFL
ncbi:hypothetical protein EDF81_4470 [Enterobacter sp. BIGb0383]|uniref:hypothetical protein n=1 Tax=unclassified Enterobacter TaxID=2608935 RepID=UPI000F47365C|nr:MULTISPECIES: hypothetical protein [unclassified Enterobacter]ROP49458.1 hypothetical protein EDF81_4470 [Enterobacter sp. BIGb0383]ROS00666.1 hypothetical protein EC848_4358 [Enterobacter sp. BIGb0359]